MIASAAIFGAALGSATGWPVDPGLRQAEAEEREDEEREDDEDDDVEEDEDDKEEEDEDVEDESERAEYENEHSRDEGDGEGPGREKVHSIAPAIETEPVPHDGDAADDAAIWVDPADPSRSTIIATDKQGGLAVYDLAGRQLQFLSDGEPNNVDLRQGFRLGGMRVALVTAGDRSDNTIRIYRLDAASRRLIDVAARPLEVGVPTYGACMYHSGATGHFYYFVTSKAGGVEQWQLFDDGGKVAAKRVRSFDVGSQSEGCVADDELGRLYVGEEAVGIWRYGAEPHAGRARTLVDSTESGRLVADVEGLAIAYGRGGKGHLVASSQGNDSFVAYRREGRNVHVATFRVDGTAGVDSAEETDGLDVTTASLGRAFRGGLLVVQDGQNDDGNQNFKLVPWASVLGSLGG